jgi:hypothetical protein
MRLETSERPSAWRLPWGHLLQLWDGPDNNAYLQDLLQAQPDKTLGKKLPFTLPTTRTLSTMWPEWTLEDDCPSLSLQDKSVSHSHSQKSEGLMDLLGLAAEDWCSRENSGPFKITSEEPRVIVQVAGRPQSSTWCYLTSQVSLILHRSPWWGWTVSPTSQRGKTILFK